MMPEGIVAADSDNLAYKAAALMAEHFAPGEAAASAGIHIAIRKNIPVAAGLAGGSTDAAAVMLALAEQWHIKASLAELCSLSVKIGADVPFCLIANAKIGATKYAADIMASTTALAEGIGDILTPLPTPVGALILFKPNLSLSTMRIYNLYDEAPGKAARPETDRFICELRDGDLTVGVPAEALPPIVTYMVNALQYAATNESPETGRLLAEIKSALPQATVFMSGSGPTVVAYFSERAEAEKTLPDMRARFEMNGVEVFFATML
jgi:4-diphosphocytidyl-2-C-methyl-D-erythritol kinase